jgi:hypothetical protein
MDVARVDRDVELVYRNFFIFCCCRFSRSLRRVPSSFRLWKHKTQARRTHAVELEKKKARCRACAAINLSEVDEKNA